MDFFNGIGKRTSDTRNRGNKVQEESQADLLTRQIQEAEALLEGLLSQYGAACYAREVKHESPAELPALQDRIGDQYQEIDALNKRLDTFNGVQRCPECGEKMPLAARFCSSCGTRMPKPEPEPEPTLTFCTSCGAPRTPGLRFCTGCGFDFGVVAPPAAPMDSAPAVEAPNPAQVEE